MVYGVKLWRLIGVTIAVGMVAGCEVSIEMESDGGISETTIPDPVKTMFQRQYPNAQPQWSQLAYGYEAVFNQNGIEYEAEFAESGEWRETEYEATEADIPPNILTTIRQQYPTATFDEFEIEITPNGQFYEVEIMTGSQEQELYFDRNAQPVPNQHEDL